MIALILDREFDHSRKCPDSWKIRLAKYMAYTVPKTEEKGLKAACPNIQYYLWS